MNSTALSTKGVKLAVSALLAAAAFMALGLAFSANNAKASTVGGSIGPDFNYVGLYVGTSIAGDVDSLVLEPPTTPIGINGTYTDTDGNFTVPKNTGLDFPPVNVDLDVVQIQGEIALTEDGTGHYDDSTGAMSMDLSLSLTLGVDDLEALSSQVDIPLGTGALGCKISPLDVSFSTAKGWPHAGSSFTDKATPADGALAGAWRYKPAITAVEGDQSVCNIIGGFLKDVGGIWLGNSTSPLADMPVATEAMPTKANCTELGKTGTYPNCVDPTCPEGQEGTPPDDCHDIVVPDPFKVSKVALSPTKATVKAGKTVKLTVKVTNSGDVAGSTTVTLKSSNKQVTLPKSVKVTIPAGKTVSKSITVKASKKAKGKATITATAAGKKGTSAVTVKALKKKKKKKH